MMQIFDIDGEKLNSIKIDFSSEEYHIEHPFIINDILKKKEKIAEIKVYPDLNILKEIGFILYGKELDKGDRWAKRQKHSLHLRQLEAPVEKTFKKLIRLPTNHYIELDINNSKVRVHGDFVDLREKGVWQEY